MALTIAVCLSMNSQVILQDRDQEVELLGGREREFKKIISYYQMFSKRPL